MDVSFRGYKFHFREASIQPNDLVWAQIIEEYRKLRPRKIRPCEVFEVRG